MASRKPHRRYNVVLRMLPCTLLILVAGHQLCLVYTQQLTPWLGGGFGMFSTIDDGVNRYLRVTLLGPHGQEPVQVPDELDEHRDRVRSLPSARAMQRFAAALAPLYAAEGMHFTSIRVEVWRTAYTTTQMRPIDRLIGVTQWKPNHGSP